MARNLLFARATIFDVTEHQKQQVVKSVQELAPNYLLNASEEDLVKTLVEDHRLNVPVINEDEIHVADYGETKVDVSQDILVFNRTANFTNVLAKISGIVSTHQCFKRDLGKSDETTSRYVFHQPSDTNRELVLTVMAFDIPSEEHRVKKAQTQRNPE